jgi:RNA polymerase subunit RPABC4/transcription elongation factor Spt4
MPTGLPDPGQLWDQFINNPIVGLVGQLIVIYAVLLWLGTAYWAFRDMQARTENPIAPYFAAALIIFFTPVVFLAAVVLYLIVRPRESLAEVYERSLAEETLLAEVEKNRLCPTCRHRVEGEWLVCPNCRTRLHRVCPTCNHLAEPDWAICAYCGTDLERVARPTTRPAAAPAGAPAAGSGPLVREGAELATDRAGLRSATNG